MEITEGGLEFTVPEEDEQVFYNPAMELNRDLTVAVLRAASAHWLDEATPTYLDAMAAAGLRGVRAAGEGYATTLCDVNPKAITYVRENLTRNDLDGEILQGDVRAHLYENRFAIVDLDPFGSPIPFVEAAVAGTSDILCVTATDTAPLCGAHFAAGRRRYGAIPANTEYHAEVGLRILLSALVRTGARADVALKPVFSHVTRHYVRTYLGVDHGAEAADAALDALGYLVHCRSCFARTTSDGLAPALPATCPSCESESIYRIGPIWLEQYCEPGRIDQIQETVDETMGTAKQIGRLLERLSNERQGVGHYDHHVLCDHLDLPAGPLADVLDGLSDRGYDATRTHFGGTTFDTNAPIDEILEVIEAGAPTSA